MAIYNHPLDKARNLSVTDSDYDNAHDRAEAEGAGGGADSYVGQQNGYFYIHRLGVWFEPYSLPEGATLTGVRLKLYAYKYIQVLKDNSFDFNIQVRKTPALENGTLEESKSDYPGMLGGTLIAQEAADNFATYLEGYTYHYIDIPTEYVDLTETTILSLISSKDAAATEPDAGTSEKLRINASASTMFLELTYTLPDAEVTTNPATSITRTSATLNGTLDYDGGESCDCSFEWGLTTGYGETTTPETKNTGETFSAGITGLITGRTYHFRAKAVNTAGTFYGADLTFTCLGYFAWII